MCQWLAAAVATQLTCFWLAHYTFINLLLINYVEINANSCGSIECGAQLERDECVPFSGHTIHNAHDETKSANEKRERDRAMQFTRRPQMIVFRASFSRSRHTPCTELSVAVIRVLNTRIGDEKQAQ